MEKTRGFGFFDQDGEELSREEAKRQAEEAETELVSLMEEVQAFRAKLAEGTLEEGDGFLSFEGPLCHGFDRTGPNQVTWEERED